MVNILCHFLRGRFLLISCLGCVFPLLSLPAQVNPGETVVDAAVKEDPAMAEIQDVPGLPRVLLIGDSISIGYTLGVRDLLKGKANVHRIPTNAGNTKRGLAHIDQWLGTSKWDVIHFNFGLHDVNCKTGSPAVPLPEYQKNLTVLVQRLQKTGAQLIWATTTPIPAGLPIPVADLKPYNAAALEIMQANNIPIDDLYSVVLPQESQIQLPHNVHYNHTGWIVLAQAVAKSIEAHLPPAPPTAK